VSVSSQVLAANRSFDSFIMIEGKSVPVTKFMCCSDNWLTNYYINPLKSEIWRLNSIINSNNNNTNRITNNNNTNRYTNNNNTNRYTNNSNNNNSKQIVASNTRTTNNNNNSKQIVPVTNNRNTTNNNNNTKQIVPVTNNRNSTNNNNSNQRKKKLNLQTHPVRVEKRQRRKRSQHQILKRFQKRVQNQQGLNGHQIMHILVAKIVLKNLECLRRENIV